MFEKIKFLKSLLSEGIQAKENKLIGGALFSNNSDVKFGQILLFEKFGICTGNNISLKSSITNHYTEENYSVNDHWAIEPTQYTMTGLIGELVYTVPKSWSKQLESLYGGTGLNILSKLSPKLGSYTQGAMNAVKKAQSVFNKYTNMIKNAIGKWLYSDVYKRTNQRKVLDELEAMMENRTLVSVYTPYGTYTNLAIISVNMRQKDNTKFTSELEVTFQKWRDAGDIGDTYSEKLATDLVAFKKQKAKEKGLIGKLKTAKNVLTGKKQAKLLPKI